ncbi:deoxynucleoside kinase [Halosquirtibacter xylanolyticus]|uniref:deoxynucleoside kinase n=1 Tax=Halosquirtibacter xylanolyticus TaxID=3374599 RepID=UPI0037480491|nr:deoxynucleoside kinase [Prolixibacteraceae bacterium]
MDINFLVIEGNIGAGKTTLSTMLSQKYNAKLILEQFSDNPFLPRFYKDPDKFSFPLEMSFMAERYNQLKQQAELDLFKTFTVSDYYFMKSLIFSKSTLQEDEYNLYRKFFDIIYQNIPKPSLYVYLHLSTERLMENISNRGRSYETEITPDYLKQITDGYFNFFSQQRDFPVVAITTDELDFVKNKADFDKIERIIFGQSYPKGLTRLIP